jgi:hypothetical protein
MRSESQSPYAAGPLPQGAVGTTYCRLIDGGTRCPYTEVHSCQRKFNLKTN